MGPRSGRWRSVVLRAASHPCYSQVWPYDVAAATLSVLSEGPALDQSGTRRYFSSQRGLVTGPSHERAV